MSNKKIRTAFEKWYSGSVKRNDNGRYRYMSTEMNWVVWKAATEHTEGLAKALLTDAEVALRDLHACDDADCTAPNCLHVLPRIREFLEER